MNARKLMLNVVVFEFTFFRSSLFVTIMDKMNEFKEIEGQAWSAWKILLSEKRFLDEDLEEYRKMIGTLKETTYCMKLPRSDMALFGLCPKTELFELVMCNFCGSKYKLSAFGEHIRLRHSDVNNTSPKLIENVIRIDKSIQKKGKSKKTKEKILKPKEKSDTPAKPEINLDMKVNFMEIVSDKQSLPIESENVSKIKQINLKLNKNFKLSENDISKEENKSLDKGNTCAIKPESKKDTSCNGSHDSNLLKPQLIVETPTAPQGGEIINLQPVVQLTPLIPICTSSEPLSVSLFPKDDKKMDLDTQHKINVDEQPQPDLQCGLLDNENSKKNIQFLSCNSQSSSSQAVIIIKNKPIDIVSPEKNNETEVSFLQNEVSTTCILEKDNNQHSSFIAAKLVKSHTIINNKIYKTEGVKLDHKQLKRITTDKPRLSLPVSIKNPTLTNSILSQLQNKVLKSKFSLPVETARSENIQDVIKENFVQKQIRNSRINRCSKENSSAQQSIPKKDGDSESSELKTVEKKMEGLKMFYPGGRRAGGLLYSNHNLPRVSGMPRNTRTIFPTLKKEEQSAASIRKAHLINLREQKEIINLVVENVSSLIDSSKKMQLEIEKSTRRAALQNKQKGQFLVSNNSKKNNTHQHRIHNNQTLNSNNTVICKRLNNNINGVVPAKMQRKDGIINIVGSVFTKNEHNVPVMHIEVPNNMFEKKIIVPAQHLTPTNTIDISGGCSVPTGVEVISGNILRSGSIRIGSPRIHYFTSSGPLPVETSPTGIQQLQLKPMRVQHKYQLLAPQINLAPTNGVYFLQKTTTNSSNINGIEEK